MDNTVYENIILKLEDELALLKCQVNDTFTLIEMAIGLCNAAIIEMRKMVVLRTYQFSIQFDRNFSCRNRLYNVKKSLQTI